MDIPEIDWAPYEKYLPALIECSCGYLYSSRSKLITHEGNLVTVTQSSCRKCKRNVGNVVAIRNPPENFEI